MKLKGTVRWVIFCCVIIFTACSGERGPQGPPGTAFPVIQGIYAQELPVSKGGTVTLTVIAQSPGGLPLTYKWMLSSDEWSFVGSASSPSVTVQAPDAYGSSATASVTVTDGEGHSAYGVIGLFTEENASPVIHSISATPNPVRRGDVIEISVSASDPQDDTLTYSWNYPDGFSATGATNSPVFTLSPWGFSSGTVEVTVSDGENQVRGLIFISTQDGTFKPPRAINERQQDVNGNFSISSSPSGYFIAAVPTNYSNTQYHVQVRMYSPESGWTGVTNVEEISTDEILSASADINSSGRAFVLYVQNSAGVYSLHANSYDPSSDAWGAATPPQESEEGS